MESERIGLLGFFRSMREFRRAAKLSRRPAMTVDAARDRYEPLVEALAAELGREFGIEFRRVERTPSRRGRRVFETTRWVAEESVAKYPHWARRLDAAVRQVADIAGPDLPLDAFGTPTEFGEEMVRRLEARGIELKALDQPADDVEIGAMSRFLTLRDRLGGDVHVAIDDDKTSISAIASLKAG